MWNGTYWLVPGCCLEDRREDCSDGDYHEDVEGEATQRIGLREKAFKDDKSDENVDLKTQLDDCQVAWMNQKNFLQNDPPFL